MANLLAIHIPPDWADEQYLSTLVDVMGEYSHIFDKKEKKKVDAETMKRFIRKE